MQLFANCLEIFVMSNSTKIGQVPTAAWHCSVFKPHSASLYALVPQTEAYQVVFKSGGCIFMRSVAHIQGKEDKKWREEKGRNFICGQHTNSSGSLWRRPSLPHQDHRFALLVKQGRQAGSEPSKRGKKSKEKYS